MSSIPARKRAQAISKEGPSAAQIVFPHAFEVAAEISARPLDAFREDPTQLTNGLTELARAIGSDGIVCLDGLGLERVEAQVATAAATLLGVRHVAASLEACKRLRTTFGDAAALVVFLEGPEALATKVTNGAVDEYAVEDAGGVLTGVVRAFAEAGADLFVIEDVDAGAGAAPASDAESWKDVWSDALTTVSRVAKFHRGAAYVRTSRLPSPLPRPEVMPLDAREVGPRGVVTTSARVARLDLPAMIAWTNAARLNDD